jgi:hypothetical protein
MIWGYPHFRKPPYDEMPGQIMSNIARIAWFAGSLTQMISKKKDGSSLLLHIIYIYVIIGFEYIL